MKILNLWQKKLIDVKIILKNILRQKWGFLTLPISLFTDIAIKHDAYEGKDIPSGKDIPTYTISLFKGILNRYDL